MEYRRKRRFDVTSEPKGRTQRTSSGRLFVIQKHDASRLHYDFRLEHHGVLLSWAVPKGPSLDPAQKSLAVQVEDHPVEYGSFEGVIPEGQYGGGTVMLWDRGTWEPLEDVDAGLRTGKLKFRLHGEKIKGGWTLVRMRGGKYGEEGKNWLLIKERDEEAVPHAKWDVREREPLSVKTGRDLREIADSADAVWDSRPVAKSARRRSTSTATQARSRPASAGSSKRNRAPQATEVTSGAERAGAGTAGPLDPAHLPGAQQAELPEAPLPELASLAKSPPAGDGWVHEIKFDGYRILALVDHGKVKLITRRGNDWTGRFSTVASDIEALGSGSLVLDGEVVVLSGEGRSDFQALQNVLQGLKKRTKLLYFVFDVLYWDGFDLTRVALLERKRALHQILAGVSTRSSLRVSEHIVGHGDQVFEQACKYRMEGIISKRAASLYFSKRTKDWVKVKCSNRQEFVIGGYTDPSGGREGFGALLLGYYDSDGDLVYCGRVGTGFDSKALRAILKEMRTREIAKAAFKNPPRGPDARGVHWLAPELVGEVRFSEWTNDGIIRQASFQGLREDKDAREVVREQAGAVGRSTRQVGSAAQAVGSQGATRHVSARSRREARRDVGVAPEVRVGPVAGVTLTNPQRVLYPELGVTKLELARYYESIANWVLPHLVHRPLSLVRCPQGRERTCFYQKHLSEMLPASVHGVPILEKNGIEEYVAIADLKGLVGLVQLGVLELHPWGSREDDVEHPDRLVFDLDPGPGIEWAQVVEGATLMQARLADLGLDSFVKTTGGKGLHVVFPIQRRTSWDDAKAFTRAIAERLVQDFPDRYLAVMTKAKRANKIFVDYLRNGRGATAIAAYSTRARENATVSMPLSWEELGENTRPEVFTVRTVPQLLVRRRRDPWEEIGRSRQSITVAMMKRVGLG